MKTIKTAAWWFIWGLFVMASLWLLSTIWEVTDKVIWHDYHQLVKLNMISFGWYGIPLLIATIAVGLRKIKTHDSDS